MARKLRAIKPTDLFGVQRAVLLLRDARDHLHRAGAKKAATRVRAALRSAEGAQRHAERLDFRARGEVVHFCTQCGGVMSAQEWRAGFRIHERCVLPVIRHRKEVVHGGS